MGRRLRVMLSVSMVLLFTAPIASAEDSVLSEEPGGANAAVTYAGGQEPILEEGEENAYPGEMADELIAEEDAAEGWTEAGTMDEISTEAVGEAEGETETIPLIEEAAGGEPDRKAAGTAYTYEIRPVLSPFNYLFFVKTEDPDPYAFRFYDSESSLYNTSESDHGICALQDELYLDVSYENEETRRVRGGYLFSCPSCDMDGGELILQTKSSADVWVNTGETVSCPPVTDMVHYLIGAYTDGSMSFFQKLDAVQAGLKSLAVYPHSVFDTSRPSSHPYPSLASSPYPELPLNEHYEIYQRSERQSFLTALYPFVLDSASFPGTMSAVAKTLDSSCTIHSVANSHWLREISAGGESRFYGGAGAGDSDPVYQDQLSYRFLFDGSADDPANVPDLDSLRSLYTQYQAIGADNVSRLREPIAGQEFVQAIGGGTWVRIAVEGWGGGSSYGYIAYGPGQSPVAVSDAWVDGRYINSNQRLVLNAAFADHPNASIVLRGQEYTDYHGKHHVNDIVYDYDPSSDTWKAPYYYADAWSYSYSMSLPDTFVLTRAQVEQMGLDAKTNRIPEGGRIYDGSVYPGTAFGNRLLEGISIPETMEIAAGETVDIPVTPIPQDATDISATWSLEPAGVMYIDNYQAYGYKPGTVTATLTTTDGSFTASCRFTILPREAAVADHQTVRAVNHLTAGQTVSQIIVEHDQFVDTRSGQRLYGRFAFDRPDEILPLGIHMVSWTFTPTQYVYGSGESINDERYTPLTGTLSVTVEKATPLLTDGYPHVQPYTWNTGTSLSSIPIEGGKTTAAGAWQWADPSETVKSGQNIYLGRFVPQYGGKYQEITREISIYGLGSGIQSPAPVLKKTQPMTVRSKKQTVKYSLLRKKKRTISAKRAFTVK